MDTLPPPPTFSIILHLRINSTAAALATAFPQENHIASILLAAAIKQALEAKGVTVTGANGSGPFNASLYCFVVSDVHPALATIRSQLEQFAVLAYATIHWFDEREMFLRPVCHGIGVNPNEPLELSAVREEIAEHQRHTQARIEHFLAFLAALAKALPAPDQQ
jgi:hypothetical protein